MTFNQATQQALDSAWNKAIARSSMERWLAVCKQNSWDPCPENLPLLASLFGASWYFTRFVFFRGHEIASYFVDLPSQTFSYTSLNTEFKEACVGQDPVARFEALRMIKNEKMLGIFLRQLSGLEQQEQVEQALSVLAEVTLSQAMEILAESEPQIKAKVAVFAMGPMAGGEMNFGSDLDLIFLYPDNASALAGHISAFVRKLIRQITARSAAGMLYELDTRLRPYGNAGVLVSSERSFLDYHRAKRDIWERQMMIRCRAIVDPRSLASSSLRKIQASIYQHFDADYLRQEIRKVRALVEGKLGGQSNQYDLKRGAGGIMDIDFLVQYMQLLHGHQDETLRTASTRQVLRQLIKAGGIAKHNGDCLLFAYDFLKKLENRLRVFDMKSVSAFSKAPTKVVELARSMDYREEIMENATQKFITDYVEQTQAVRGIFIDHLSQI